MSIQFHLIFGVLVSEMALLTIFMLPLPRSWYAAAAADPTAPRVAPPLR